MHTLDPFSTRIMHFSNPSVNFMGVSTGVANTYHEARVISENSINVVNFRPSVTQPFGALIVGPTNITSSGWYNWELYFFCQPLGSTTWQFSTDGFNYGSPVGFGDAVNFYPVSDLDNGTLFLRCIINNGGTNYTTTTTINVDICPSCRLASDETTEIKVMNQETGIRYIYPNPADKMVTIEFSLDQTSDVEFDLTDMVGLSRTRMHLKGLRPGSHAKELDISALCTGVYVCRFSGAGKTGSKSFVVVK